MGILLAGLGAGAYTYYQARQDAQVKAEKAEKARAAAEAQRRAIKLHAASVAELEEPLDLFKDVDARLDVGMTFRDYSDLVSDASSALAGVDESALSPGFDDILADLEEVKSGYASVAAAWDDCIWDTWCDSDLASLDWQDAWSDNKTALAAIDSQIAGLDPESNGGGGADSVEL